MDIMKDLETLCGVISDKISEKTRKIKNSGMNDGDLETIDKLTHSLASVNPIAEGRIVISAGIAWAGIPENADIPGTTWQTKCGI